MHQSAATDRPPVSADLAAAPHDRFDDLYSAVYAILDDAKACRRLIKLYKGSHLSPQPHELVLAFGAHFADQRRGLLSFACTQVRVAPQYLHHGGPT